MPKPSISFWRSPYPFLPPSASSTSSRSRFLRASWNLNWNLVQSIILNAKFAPACPKVTAVPDDGDAWRDQRARGHSRLCRGEAVKADEIHEESGIASRSH